MVNLPPIARRAPTALVAATLAVLLALGGGLALAPSSAALTNAELSAEIDYVRRINEIRRSHGLRPLVEDVELARKARGWSIHQANGGCPPPGICHDPNQPGGITTPWTKLGENVAVGGIGGNGAIMAMFMGSPGHRQNLLDPAFTRVGVGVIHRNGAQFVTHKFMAVPGEVIAANAPLAQRYVDVRYDHTFYTEIERLSVSGIIKGGPDRAFQPARVVSRQETAAFLYRLAGSPGGSFPNPGLRDVGPGHPFYREIAWMVDAGIAKGFPDGTFRPTRSTDRAAMSAYLHALAGAGPGPFQNPGFHDVGPGHPFYTSIAWLKDAGVGGGYPDGTFRPGNAVTRGEMTAFLYRFAN